jgi:excisionase family DNA binding protein
MRQPKPSEPKHLTASQAAALLQVSPKTVSRWAKEGKLPFVRTLGGHRRYPDSEIRALVDSLSERVPGLSSPSDAGRSDRLSTSARISLSG